MFGTYLPDGLLNFHKKERKTDRPNYKRKFRRSVQASLFNW